MAKATTQPRRPIRCYLCGNRFEVSPRTMSTTCPECNRAIKVENITVKNYLPVNELQTCGQVTITAKGRVVAKKIEAGDGIVCDGTLEGIVETDGTMTLGPKATWKGQRLSSRSLSIAKGAKLVGAITVPWQREEKPPKVKVKKSTPKRPASKRS